MNKQKLFFLLSLVVVTLQSAEQPRPDFEFNARFKMPFGSTQDTETFKKVQIFGAAVWAEMQRQPASFLAGVGLGACMHLSSLAAPHYKTIGEVTGKEKLSNSTLIVDDLVVTEQTLQRLKTEPFIIRIFQHQDNHLTDLGTRYNDLLKERVAVQTHVTWQQKVPHIATIAGIYGATQFKNDLFEVKPARKPVEKNVIYAATAANIVLGFGLSYATLAVINNVIKP